MDMSNLKSTRRRLLALYLLCTCVCLQSQSVAAEPWINAGDERSRHHLQVLADRGLINLPLTTWPLMWSSVSRELNRIDIKTLDDNEQWSYQYLRHELRRAQRGFIAGQTLTANSSRPGLSDYARTSRERLESRSYLGFTGDHWAFKLQASIVGDDIDGHRFRADGSYLAGIWGNWAMGVGAIDRWWGPGWQSSLILSDNARPSPGIFIHRVDNHAFDLPVLKWLGPWDLNLFLNQLEGNRATPHAKLVGMRVNFKPLNRLEIGLSRTAQWGGEGRPEDMETFFNLLIGRDNRGEGEINADGSNEPGNQLGGIDWRLSQSYAGISGAFYGQIVGEDEAGNLPSHVLGLAGIETSFTWGSTHSRLAVEASNTTMEFNKGGTPNSAYEHPRYPSGYRYYGLPIAASTDNDSELAVLKGFHSLAKGHQFNWTAGSGKINVDRTNSTAPAGNVFGQGADLWFATVKYSLPLADRSQLSIGGQYYSESLLIGGEIIETGASITYELRL